jgi:hypothetical protein
MIILTILKEAKFIPDNWQQLQHTAGEITVVQRRGIFSLS